MKRWRNSFKGRGRGPLPKLSGPSLKRLSPGSQVGIFDVIIAIDVLEHLPREKLLNTPVITYKSLTPSGRLIFAGPIRFALLHHLIVRPLYVLVYYHFHGEFPELSSK